MKACHSRKMQRTFLRHRHKTIPGLDGRNWANLGSASRAFRHWLLNQKRLDVRIREVDPKKLRKARREAKHMQCLAGGEWVPVNDLTRDEMLVAFVHAINALEAVDLHACRAARAVECWRRGA